MYTRFNDNTIETKFVKQLVAQTLVPFISTWKPGDFAIRGMVYITRDAIWRCNHTGYPRSLTDTCTPAKHVRIHDKNIPKSYGGSLPIPYFTKVAPYNFGEEYYNVTGTYQSNILGYDATTHFYLGQYLRMMRDLFDLNLMPFYNCFCGEYVSDVDFNSDSQLLPVTSNQFKIASVPVRFGKTYTIAINSELPVETMLVVYGKKGVLTELTNNLNDINQSQIDDNGKTTISAEGTYRKYLKTSFEHPILYRTKDWHLLYNIYTKVNGRYESVADDNEVFNNVNYDLALGLFEKYLRLLIKVPATNKSSLVVLEGDYTLDLTYESANTDSVTWTNESQYGTTVNNRVVTGEQIQPVIIKNYAPDNGEQSLVDDRIVLLSPLGLLQMSDGNSYAFSNRLIEYLLLNVINPLEEFGDNIKRIQTYARSQENYMRNADRYTAPYTPGVWDDSLREHLFRLTSKTHYLTTKVDLTGYVDKDTERIITRGLKV